MAMQCMNCGKGVMYGNNVSHAKNRTKRTFKPNLQLVRIPMGTMMKRVRLCTKCLRMIKRNLKAQTEIEETSQATI